MHHRHRNYNPRSSTASSSIGCGCGCGGGCWCGCGIGTGTKAHENSHRSFKVSYANRWCRLSYGISKKNMPVVMGAAAPMIDWANCWHMLIVLLEYVNSSPNMLLIIRVLTSLLWWPKVAHRLRFWRSYAYSGGCASAAILAELCLCLYGYAYAYAYRL